MKNFFLNKKDLYINILIFIILILFITVFLFAIYNFFSKDFNTQDTDIAVSNVVSTLSENIVNETDNIEHEIIYIEMLPEDDVISNQVIYTPDELVTGKSPYYIRVNYGANVVTIYTKDDSGYYTVPFKAMICSCGTATPKAGTYETSSKYEWLSLVGNVNGQYATRIVNRILFHSVPYLKQSPDTLEYWEYDKLGTTASAGCIRLTVEDAKWIYDNCTSGTKVEFYSDENPGPLGKPTAQKISSNEECRNWDPTDPSTQNPWKNYNENN